MGITNEPTIDNLVKGPMKLKFYKILVKDKYPADSTVAGLLIFWMMIKVLKLKKFIKIN